MQRLAPDSQAYALAQAVLETERQEVAVLQAEYKASKAELDRVEKERKAATVAAATAAASSLAQSTSQSSGTGIQNTAKYYSGAGAVSKPSSSSASSPTVGRPPLPTTYGYAYQSGYQQPYMASSSNTYGPTATYAYTNPSSSSSVLASTPMALPSQPIPVTLPVSSLTSLASLGIVPMHPSHAEQQPGPVAAILRGTTQNGTMVSLEINVAALGGAQASGLAVLLGALTSGGVGGGSAGAGAGATSSATSVSGNESSKVEEK
jgi:hypothetical protein